MYMYSKWVVKYILISLNKAVCFGVYHTYNDGNKFYYLFYLYSVTSVTVVLMNLCLKLHRITLYLTLKTIKKTLKGKRLTIGDLTLSFIIQIFQYNLWFSLKMLAN